MHSNQNGEIGYLLIDVIRYLQDNFIESKEWKDDIYRELLIILEKHLGIDSISSILDRNNFYIRSNDNCPKFIIEERKKILEETKQKILNFINKNDKINDIVL